MNAHLHSLQQLSDVLSAQQQAFRQHGPVSGEVRKRRIQAVIDLLVDQHQPLAEAMDADFGGRHLGYSLMNDVLGSLTALKHARDHLESWMPADPRPPFAPYDQLGAKAWVQYQPKGSVGIIGTWNAPLFTLLAPLASVYAAGNRAILKPSEVTSRTAQVLARAIGERFDPLELAIINGDAAIGRGFACQPFDHLVFTGSIRVGRDIMRQAAEHLVPLTLELGGKSPVIIGRSANLAEAARRLAIAKATNAGQLCISPDLIYIPLEQQAAFMNAFTTAYSALLPEVADNPDLVSIINPIHLERLERYLNQAREQGTQIVRCPDIAVDPSSRKRPLSIVVNPPPDSQIMREEIFGPALVLLSYTEIGKVIAEINTQGRPLALYYFGEERAEQEYVLAHTLSGGVTINDALMHAAMTQAPFGGVGSSGMGHYHGREGFIEFSHVRTVFHAPKIDPRGDWGVLPPWPEHFQASISAQITR